LRREARREKETLIANQKPPQQDKSQKGIAKAKVVRISEEICEGIYIQVGTQK
jgi:hypothetical protein